MIGGGKKMHIFLGKKKKGAHVGCRSFENLFNGVHPQGPIHPK